MKQKTFVLICLVLVAVSIFPVHADGGYFPEPGYWVRPGQQKAAILFENNVETMIVTSGFQGNSKKLVWIVPTPTKPEVTKSSGKVFQNLEVLTQVHYQNPSFEYGVASSMIDKSSGVQVIESKQVDYYDVNIVLATNADDLVKWFNDNGYQYSQEYAYVLNSYIQKGWYFTAIKVSPESQKATDVLQDFKEGNPTPIKMVFLSEKLVFPLKISSVDFPPIFKAAAEEFPNTIRVIDNRFYTKLDDGRWQGDQRYSPVLMYDNEYMDRQVGGINYQYYQYSDTVPISLYVLADDKYVADGFSTQYANKVSRQQVEDLGYDDQGEPYIIPTKDEYYLTRLYANFQKSQMDDDLVLRKAPDNRKINAGMETSDLVLLIGLFALFTFLIWLFSPLGIVFVIGCFMLALARTPGVRTAGRVMSIISMILTSIALLFIVIIGVIYYTSIARVEYYPLSTVPITLCAILLVSLFLTLKFWNQKEVNKKLSK